MKIYSCIENFEETCHFLFHDIQNAILMTTKSVSVAVCGSVFLGAKSEMVTCKQRNGREREEVV